MENYPDSRPYIELKSRDGLTDNHLHSLKEFLYEKVKVLLIFANLINSCYDFCFFFQAEENLGMVMIFTLISETQEFLNEAVEKEKNSQEEERQRKLKEAEEAELVSEISYE